MLRLTSKLKILQINLIIRNYLIIDFSEIKRRCRNKDSVITADKMFCYSQVMG